MKNIYLFSFNNFFFYFLLKHIQIQMIKLSVLNYLNSLKYFSASFLQNDGENLSEGKVYIGKKELGQNIFHQQKF